ncbi:MAG: gamma-glutamyltransferase [Planctomycetes bacterium]|nr:gamma-glutamyltransferase [Planctomycetota bacterium]
MGAIAVRPPRALLPGLLALVVLLAGSGCASAPVDRSAAVRLEHATTTDGGAVACVDRSAARVGASILARGGNAIDAAVATAFALAVTWPPAGNLGGGGMLLLQRADGRSEAIDFRETAPAGSTPDLFLDTDGRYDPSLAEAPYRAIGVPGTPAGLYLAHELHGRLPWAELVEPARRLAADGFLVDETLADWFAAFATELAAIPSTAAVFLDDHGHTPVAGSLLRQPELAETLALLRDVGPDAFYRGPVARALARAVTSGGGRMTTDDLAAYRAVRRVPLRTRFAGATVLGMPPPSSGGLAVAQILGQLGRLHWRDTRPGSADALHLLVESERRAFADRARWLGDPDQGSVPLDALLSDEHLDALAAGVDPEHASDSHAFGPPVTELDEPKQTTHVSVLDAEGNAVAMTVTLEEAFGCKVVAAGTGVLLNDELRDFNRVPGRSTPAGLIGTAANLAAPGKRPLTSMTPTIVLRDDRVALVTGSPGGRTIISTVAQIVLAVIGRRTPLEDAVPAPRLHHQWFPDRIDLEPGRFPSDVVDALVARGHVVRENDAAPPPLHGSQGAAHSIAVDASGRVHAVGDPRRDGWVGVIDR